MPKDPIFVRVHKKYYLDPMVSRSCGMNSTVTYKWTVNDYLDKSKTELEWRKAYIEINIFRNSE